MQLVKRGANVKVASTAGATPLYAAINTQWLPRSRFPQPQAVQMQKTTHIELMTALLDAGADVNVRLKKNLWYFAFNNCGNANCGLEYLDSTTAFWRAAYAVDVEAMRLLKARGADHTLPSRRTAPARGARGAATPRPEAGGARAADSGSTRAVGAAAWVRAPRERPLRSRLRDPRPVPPSSGMSWDPRRVAAPVDLYRRRSIQPWIPRPRPYRPDSASTRFTPLQVSATATASPATRIVTRPTAGWRR